MDRKVAFITGTSRGIGRATAVAMAEAGYNVVLTARTLKEGESHRHMISTHNGKPLPGSLETTAELVKSQGGKALAIRMDLLDLSTIDSAVEVVQNLIHRCLCWKVAGVSDTVPAKLRSTVWPVS